MGLRAEDDGESEGRVVITRIEDEPGDAPDGVADEGVGATGKDGLGAWRHETAEDNIRCGPGDAEGGREQRWRARELAGVAVRGRFSRDENT